METKEVTEEEIWHLLEGVYDPEIPVLSVVDLGMIREVIKVEGEDFDWLIKLTPTYTACPATNFMARDCMKKLKSEGIKSRVKTVITPPWTTDWMTESGKQKLLEYGIAPPQNDGDVSTLFSTGPKVSCPNCGSTDTKLTSQFGSTACKSLYSCNHCHEPFEYFKCHR